MSKYRLVNKLRNQIEYWPKYIRYEIRFILCGIFSYASFLLLRDLGSIATADVDALVSYLFDPKALFLAIAGVSLGYIGLGFAVIAAALFNSLVPKNR